VYLNQDTVHLGQQENTPGGSGPGPVAANFSQAQVANQATLSATSQVLRQKTALDYII
jgi:hypothetical protein